MNEFHYQNQALFCENVNLSEVARQYGTPAYVYSAAGIRSRFHAYEDALAGIRHRVCFAVKANSSLAVLALLASEGAGFDIVSGGELYRVLRAGGDPASVVFSGVGKTEAEIRYALESGIHNFNCESEPEVALISEIAVSLRRTASIAIRVNPDVDAVTHPYISTGLKEHKFGIDIAEAEAIYLRAARLPGIAVEGVSCHIGSQLLTLEPLLQAADKVIALLQRLRAAGVPIKDLDLGGGLGIPYKPGDSGVAVQDFIAGLRPKLEALNVTLMLEPGRSVVAESGVLLSTVLLTKKNGEKTFTIVDAAMNDLIRPALYQAYHEIVPVTVAERTTRTVDVVGPVCESGDFFARDRELPEMNAGEVLALRNAGAYGFTLSSNYNSRPRSCELLIDGDRIYVARQRETYEDLVRGELIPSFGECETDENDGRVERDICTEPA